MSSRRLVIWHHSHGTLHDLLDIQPPIWRWAPGDVDASAGRLLSESHRWPDAGGGADFARGRADAAVERRLNLGLRGHALQSVRGEQSGTDPAK